MIFTPKTRVQSGTSFSGQDIVFGTVDISVISQPKWLKFGLQAHFFKMFGHTNFQLSISCTFKVITVLVVYLRISTKCFITMKVQEIESWNFVCPNTFRNCAWRPNFSHFGWEMTKISIVPVMMSCPENDVPDCTWAWAVSGMETLKLCTPSPNSLKLKEFLSFFRLRESDYFLLMDSR